MLVPLRALLDVNVNLARRTRTPLAEVFVQPFAVWTSITVDLTGRWDQIREVADELNDAMDTSVVLAGNELGRLRDGIDLQTLTAHLDPVPWQHVPQLVDVGTITIVSGLCSSTADVMVQAPLFRSGFTGGGGGTVHRLTKREGAAATTSGQIGLVLADTSNKAPTFIKCLHHNHSLLAGHLLALSSIVEPDIPVAGENYQEWAARCLNHLHRGVAMRGAGIYKSRVAPAWLERKGLLAAIDHRTAFFAKDPVPRLVPPPSANKDNDD